MINIKVILLLSLAAYEECSGGNFSTCCTKGDISDDAIIGRVQPSGQPNEGCTKGKSIERGESSGQHSANDVPTYIKDIGTLTTIYNIEDAVYNLGDNVSVEFKGEALLINGKEIQGVNPWPHKKSRDIQKEGVVRRGVETSTSHTSRNFPLPDFYVVQFDNDTIGDINREPERKILTFRGDTLLIDGKKVPGVDARKRPLLIEWGKGVLKIDGTINKEFGAIRGKGCWEC